MKGPAARWGRPWGVGGALARGPPLRAGAEIGHSGWPAGPRGLGQISWLVTCRTSGARPPRRPRTGPSQVSHVSGRGGREVAENRVPYNL
ncbi:hypothetical protein GCM10010519_80910 [Streptomyces lactacystinicus]